jgi:hypothetical protein
VDGSSIDFPSTELRAISDAFVILSISIITYFATNLIVVENVFEVQLVSMVMLFDCSSLRWSASRLAAI